MTEGSAALEQRGRRVGALDGLRGVAALTVVGYHYFLHGPELYPEQLGQPVREAIVGREGVRLFFMISGFVIAMSLRRSTVRSFATSRFIRLYPTYWLALAITFTVVAVFGLPEREVSWVDGLVNVTMIQGFLGFTHVEGAYWTLGVELLFYVTCAALWFGGLLSARRLPITLYVWLAAMAAAILLIPEDQEAWHQAVDNLPWFMLGIIALAIFEGDRRPAVLAFPIVGVAVVALANVNVAVFGAALYVVFLAVLLWRPFGLTSRPLRFLGDISYPLYLLHQNVGYVVLLALAGLGVPRYVGVAATVVLMLAAATAVTFLFDQPVRRALRRRLLPARRGPAAAISLP